MADKQLAPYTARQERTGNVVIKVMSTLNTWLYRVSKGRIGGKFLGAPVCLLTTTGRKSGEPRTMPLLYLADGDDIIIVASKGGYSQHPMWYLNLVADPAVVVEIRGERQEMTARTVSAEEKAALWPRLVEMYDQYDDYAARTTRDIPVVRCSPNLG